MAHRSKRLSPASAIPDVGNLALPCAQNVHTEEEKAKGSKEQRGKISEKQDVISTKDAFPQNHVLRGQFGDLFLDSQPPHQPEVEDNDDEAKTALCHLPAPPQVTVPFSFSH